MRIVLLFIGLCGIVLAADMLMSILCLGIPDADGAGERIAVIGLCARPLLGLQVLSALRATARGDLLSILQVVSVGSYCAVFFVAVGLGIFDLDVSPGGMRMHLLAAASLFALIAGIVAWRRAAKLSLERDRYAVR